MAKILLVEDNELVRRSLCALLVRSGFEVDEAVDGEESIDLFQRNKYDLIVTDLFLPKMSGIKVVTELRRLSPEVPIVAISGGGCLGRKFLLGEAEKLGADAVFGKPIENAEFVGEIRELLASKPRASNAPASSVFQ